jgi:hypothetical protein
MIRILSVFFCALSITTAVGAHETHSSQLDDQTEKKVHALFKRLVTLDDETISWHCFAQRMSELLKNDERYAILSAKFADISTSKSGLSIGAQLRPYRNEMPQSARAIFDELSVAQLYKIIKARIELNEKITCTSNHDKDEL